jgi:hypothetical protein
MPINSTTGLGVRILAVVAPLVGCGGDEKPAADAAIDAPALDCSSYCAEVQSNCSGANLQYSSTAECMAACASFPVGTSTVTDMTGNTLGCRIYHAGAPAMMAAATHCPHAGPGGDMISPAAGTYCSGGDVCQSFCALEIKACGSIEAPLPNNPRDAAGNPLFQYRNPERCVTVCDGFDKSHAYSTTAVGDSLACRLYRAVKAASSPENAVMYCFSTGSNPNDDCAGAASP